jgi:hypothetical protein
MNRSAVPRSANKCRRANTATGFDRSSLTPRGTCPAGWGLVGAIRLTSKNSFLPVASVGAGVLSPAREAVQPAPKNAIRTIKQALRFIFFTLTMAERAVMGGSITTTSGVVGG